MTEYVSPIKPVSIFDQLFQSANGIYSRFPLKCAVSHVHPDLVVITLALYESVYVIVVKSDG